MSQRLKEVDEPEVSNLWPFAFGGLSVSHGAAFGAFMSKIDFQPGYGPVIGYGLFLALTTLFVIYMSFLAYAIKNLKGNYVSPSVASFVLLAASFGMLVPHVPDGVENTGLIYMFVTLLSWSGFSIVSAMILRDGEKNP